MLRISIDKGKPHSTALRPSISVRPARRSTQPFRISLQSLFALSSFLLSLSSPSLQSPFPSLHIFFSLYPSYIANMVSASKAARLAKRAEEKKPKKATKVELDAHGNPIVEDAPATKDQSAVDKLTAQMDKHGLSDRVTTGVLSSLPASRDVKITSCSLVFHGKVLVTDSTLELTFGRRYGLLGENGCGKSTILKSIAAREYPVPEHIDIYLLNEGAPPTDFGALDWVVREAERQLADMERKAEEVLEEDGPDSPILEDLYDVCVSDFLFS